MNLNDGTKSYNQILLGYTKSATNTVDSGIDGKMLDTSKTILYNLIDDKEFVIQGRGLPFSDDDLVKLGLKVTEASNFEINIEQVDGLFNTQDIFLKDKYTNAIHNLKQEPYYFISQVGTFNDRFELIYKKPINEVVITESDAIVLVKNGNLIIQSYQSEIADITIYDITGKQIYTTKAINEKYLEIDSIEKRNQALLIEITLVNNKKTTKKIIL